jgi:hypothetical protein
MERENLDVSHISPNSSPNSNSGLSRGKVIGIIVGSAAGGLLFVVILGLLIRCICQRRKVSSNQEKPGSNSVSNPKPPRSGSVWSFFPKRDPKLATQVVSSKRVSVPIFHSDKLDDDFSDTSFVLPELGGPNPHNKFDGMEWVDIKGMDDDVLVEISTDLRKYQQHQRQ